MDRIRRTRWRMKPWTRTRSVIACTAARGAATLTLATLVLATFANGAMAQTNLVQNGNFAISGGTTSFQFGLTGGGYSPTESLADWTSTGYNFVFLPTSTVANGSSGTLTLWSPVSSPASGNGFTNASPTGGNFVAADSDYETEAISQTITGLTVGKTYAVSFAWAGAQQEGPSYISPTTDQWSVTLGGSGTQSTPVLDVTGKGFSGWMTETFDYVATSSTEVLSFLASGTPAGQPPFALLANVSMTQVPEPASLMVMGTGLAGLLVLATRRRIRPKATA
jgi:hypothetical protein